MTRVAPSSWLNRALLDEIVGPARDVAIAADARDGLVARYYPSGQLATLACYSGGSADAAWALDLDEGVESGRAVLEEGSGGSADLEVYREGRYERFDAWSDNTRPQPSSYEAWVRRWIAAIVDTARRQAERSRHRARARDALPVRDDDE